jgi:hypothetical protein
MLQKGLLFSFIICISINVNAQKVKIITPAQDSAVSQALAFFPELQHLKIIFRTKKTKTPFTSRPTALSIFKKPSKRTYLITISAQSIPMLNGIIKDSLSHKAQVGVLGHELSHIVEYNTKGTWWFIKLLARHLSTRAMDVFEYNTDYRTIQHGMGNYLLAWSTEVRQKLKVTSFNRSKSKGMMERERYMHPPTIIRIMKELGQN